MSVPILNVPLHLTDENQISPLINVYNYAKNYSITPDNNPAINTKCFIIQQQQSDLKRKS